MIQSQPIMIRFGQRLLIIKSDRNAQSQLMYVHGGRSGDNVCRFEDAK